MWMHNGGIAGWKDGVKRLLIMDVEEKWFDAVKGTTDSEWAFALFLDTLEKMGVDPDEVGKATSGMNNRSVGHTVLRKAVVKTIERLNGYISTLRQRGVKVGQSLLNFAITDGKSVVCSRYVGSKTDAAASLFFSSGSKWVKDEESQDYRMERRDRGADIVVVASEPLTFERGNLVKR